MVTSFPHPLSGLSIHETNRARDLVLKLHPGTVIDFRATFLLEPPKAEVKEFLELEHADRITSDTPRPARLAQVRYDVIGGSKAAEYHESVIDLLKAKRISHQIIGPEHHAGLTVFEFEKLVECVKTSSLFQEKLKAIQLPPGFELVVEPWPYASGNPDSNFYAFPIPLIPIMDARKNEIPEGPSFTISDPNLIEWQKWRMRVTFNPREGAVLHDIRYDGRNVLYRLSISDMTVPYADPRAPFHLNNLTLGCDCLGVIKYFDGVLTKADGSAEVTKNVVCLHEQDNGINWKHTNWRTGRAVVTRRRELVVQFIITLANYEYIFAFKFDQAAGIAVEARATGIVSVVNIDAGKTAPWGNVVSPGALAQNHQHIFCVRIDPAIDGHRNTLVQEESLPNGMDKRTNPNGNYYEVRQTPITTSVGVDLAPFNNRVFKVQNLSKRNPVSGKPVGYKRALFAQHHIWVTNREIGGVADAAARKEDILDEDIVVWSVFGLTHNPRVEDWPVMPVEMLQVDITPSDFFTENPALDVPSSADIGSKRVLDRCCADKGLSKKPGEKSRL
ncbi:copper amine oxidase, enzyme domain-containing protein [Hirsutella rhossiliensis]|uniref:Amine oxidase n=1 Tax=Hirsutella rhossiliensis TaxID=111463 RepID=A0A9P8SDP8_9HYPO|nr:copper amine oxidase, enzyme domain-containing protein [Hirsutella rhossiliensis]KAH0958189.1 copper amine oxidase, enzyme domain-containing protein [Hirsutella rhossiliensis]